jgi:hypothetical protein
MSVLLKNTSLPDLSRDSDPFLKILETVPDLSVLMETAEWLDFISPDLAQIRTYTHRSPSHSHRRGRDCINGTLQLADGVHKSIRDKAISIFAEVEDDDRSSESKELLIRLASDLAWHELYKHKRVSNKPTEEFVHSPSFVNIGYAHTARLTVAEVRQQLHDAIDENPGEKIPEEEIQEFIYQLSKKVLLPWPKEPTDPVARQDLAVRYLFHHAYLTYLAGAPVLTREEITSHFNDFQATVETLREQAEKLASFGFERHAEELRRIAFDCSSRNTDALENRWIVSRERTSSRLRAYVFTLAELNKRLFRAPLYGTLASIANAAFKLKNPTRLDAARVREMLRGPKPRIAGRDISRHFTPWGYTTGNKT